MDLKDKVDILGKKSDFFKTRTAESDAKQSQENFITLNCNRFVIKKS